MENDRNIVKHAGGRPPFVPTKEQRNTVEMMAAFGVPEEDIRQIILTDKGKAISKGCLRKHFHTELKTGSTKATAKVGMNLYRIATGNEPGAVGAAIFWMKTRAGWRETVGVTGSDGGPIRHAMKVVFEDGASDDDEPAA